MTPLGQYARSTADLTPSHVKYFGGKASNHGFLRRGSYGTDGAGHERPPASAPCLARELGACD